VPPKRCPECGRFLANRLVASLTEGPEPCPRCGTELRPETIVGGDRDRPAVSQPPARRLQVGADAAPVSRDEPATEGAGHVQSRAEEPAADSIRPPDLDPDVVRTPDDDVLAGWDLGATDEEIASWRADEPPFPIDLVVVGGTALLGGLLGALLVERDRARWAAIGALGGAVGAGVVRRIWELRG